jgi:hypothetical protein
MIRRKHNEVGRTKKPSAKKPSRSKIVQKLDTVFSLYVRTKHSKNGMCTCCTCGRKFEIKKIQAGHFQSRKHYATRWDELNVHPQCPKCNVFSQGEQYEYAKFLDRTYGQGTADSLVEKARKIEKFSQSELESVIDYYQQELRRLSH